MLKFISLLMFRLACMERLPQLYRWLFDSHDGAANSLVARWLFLRALAAVYFSAFFSLAFQIKGLIGPKGILPAQQYLAWAARAMGASRYWNVPSLFWLSADSHMLMAVVWIGLIASVLIFLNVSPRLNLLICFVCFLSFVAVAGDFSGYQSDGMLLEAGFLAFFFAPPGLLPGYGAGHPPSRASLFLLLWEWFRIYFESGMVKILSGDKQWRNFTAMDGYYQNSPLPTWIGWYVAHLPHWFHAATVVVTLLLEFVLVLMLFSPRRVRLICFWIVTPWQIGVILTGNYAFLNYLVAVLGFLLLDDAYLRRLVPARFRRPIPAEQDSLEQGSTPLRKGRHPARVAIAAVLLTWVGYATIVEMGAMVISRVPLPVAPVKALEPFRIANQYGLFAVMTRGRYEIEFQASNDGMNWQPYLFRYKPQALNEAPRIYAPYQPRFDWNLWFASLGDWRQNELVVLTEERLLANDGDVLSLFRSDPFPHSPPRYVRAVLWQYWFTSLAEKRQTGDWWKRQMLGLYAPMITRGADGHIVAVRIPQQLPTHD